MSDHDLLEGAALTIRAQDAPGTVLMGAALCRRLALLVEMQALMLARLEAQGFDPWSGEGRELRLFREFHHESMHDLLRLPWQVRP